MSVELRLLRCRVLSRKDARRELSARLRNWLFFKARLLELAKQRHYFADRRRPAFDRMSFGRALDRRINLKKWAPRSARGLRTSTRSRLTRELIGDCFAWYKLLL